MPRLDENRQEWGAHYEWPQGGDEWSEWWGGTASLWYGALLPRIRDFVPTGTILEIAPGFGRCTQYLKETCERLVLVDIAESCITACKERFAENTNIEYHVNDGISLAMVAPGSIDFVFSFDSLVHAEADVMEAYLAQLAEKLTPDGIGFLHHSNVGAFMNGLTRRVYPFGNMFRKEKLTPGWRAESMSAQRFAQFATAAGLSCPTQELINWGRRLPIPVDCFSVITPVGSIWAGSRRVFRNLRFMGEASHLARIASYYGLHHIDQGTHAARK